MSVGTVSSGVTVVCVRSRLLSARWAAADPQPRGAVLAADVVEVVVGPWCESWLSGSSDQSGGPTVPDGCCSRGGCVGGGVVCRSLRWYACRWCAFQWVRTGWWRCVMRGHARRCMDAFAYPPGRMHLASLDCVNQSQRFYALAPVPSVWMWSSSLSRSTTCALAAWAVWMLASGGGGAAVAVGGASVRLALSTDCALAALEWLDAASALSLLAACSCSLAVCWMGVRGGSRPSSVVVSGATGVPVGPTVVACGEVGAAAGGAGVVAGGVQPVSCMSILRMSVICVSMWLVRRSCSCSLCSSCCCSLLRSSLLLNGDLSVVNGAAAGVEAGGEEPAEVKGEEPDCGGSSPSCPPP